ncbi:hypothetical protein ACFXKG_23770 [Streptomyces sp. NPDC059255]|uniref:hypothetical protein n=1 Tax=Streptomyces sp. NPDC059255 TaxID=3346793 RepID=UPI0036996F4F
MKIDLLGTPTAACRGGAPRKLPSTRYRLPWLAPVGGGSSGGVLSAAAVARRS